MHAKQEATTTTISQKYLLCALLISISVHRTKCNEKFLSVVVIVMHRYIRSKWMMLCRLSPVAMHSEIEQNTHMYVFKRLKKCWVTVYRVSDWYEEAHQWRPMSFASLFLRFFFLSLYCKWEAHVCSPLDVVVKPFQFTRQTELTNDYYYYYYY